MADKSSTHDYWQANVRVILISLAIWFISSFGLGIILRPALKGISVGGADLGFWMAPHYTTHPVFGHSVRILRHGSIASRGSVLSLLRMWSKPARKKDLA